jgi:hypothetical protein
MAPGVARALLKVLDRFAPLTAKVELTGKNGGPIEIAATSARDKLAQQFDRIAKAGGKNKAA